MNITTQSISFCAKPDQRNLIRKEENTKPLLKLTKKDKEEFDKLKKEIKELEAIAYEGDRFIKSSRHVTKKALKKQDYVEYLICELNEIIYRIKKDRYAKQLENWAKTHKL